jgi:hypothetical protein
VAKPGFFGTDGKYTFDASTQYMKVPHLRNMYQKVGMFGMANTYVLGDPSGILEFRPEPFTDTTFQGDQVRGFGFLHDGSVDTLCRFHAVTAFVKRPQNPGGFPEDVAANIKARRQMESFMMAFDSNLAPIVGQQVTLTTAGGTGEAARIDLLEARAAAGECDLVVHGLLGARAAGFLSDTFLPDTAHGAKLTDHALRALRKTGPLTFTAVPPQSGRRIALDRDLDGVLNGDD